MNNGVPRQHRRASRLVIALLLTGTAAPLVANTSTGASDAAAQSPASDQHQEILIVGQSLFHDVKPEADLDRDAIDSYGAGTVDELLDEVQSEFGDDVQPMILVNGERVNGLQDIGAFPVEAIRKLQVLPRGSAVRLGGSTGQRVLSLTLQRKMRAGTLTGAAKTATEGDWHAGRGEALVTYIQGATRANIGLRVRGESSLLESERGIIQPVPLRPYAIQGNVAGYPDPSGEIDPLLSALAGNIVTVVPVLTIPEPALGDFAAAANQPNTTDLGNFRTLRPKVRNYDFNGTFATRLAPWLTTNASLRLTRNVNRALRGLPSGQFLLPAENAFSPFSTDVTLLYYGRDPLRSRYLRDTGEGRVTFNGRFGQWIGNLNAGHSESRDIIDTDRQTAFGFLPLGDSVNPFAADLSDLIGTTTDRARSRNISDNAQLSFVGPLLTLPAGPVQATVEGQLSWYRFHSRSSFFTSSNRDFHRHEQAIRGAIDVPIAARGVGLLGRIGDLSATAEYGRTHYSDAGAFGRWAVGLTWEPIAPIQLRGSIEDGDTPPSVQVLGDPVVEVSDFRVFDPLTGETVDVSQITGGNPSLRPERLKIQRFSGTFDLLPRYNLQLTAEYTDTDARNYLSALPPASLPVMLAFPDRFIRDADGTLTTVDLRPVNFDSHREKRLRWGLSMRAKLAAGNILGSGAAGESAADSDSGHDGPSPAPAKGRTPSTYLQFSANHTIVFSDKLLIRSGLDTVDLLGGGALGIGGGRVRHQVDATAALTSGGLGARAGVTWRGASRLDTNFAGITDTLRFSPVFLLNLRLFADARRILPRSDWAKGVRVSLDVVNLLNDRQSVHDFQGNTPLQYQPAYRDPLGRTIEFEIRKVF
jgi:hypothetical protein